MKNYSKEEIERLISRFENQSLPKIEWTHEAHLVVAIWYSKYYTIEEEAMDLVREFITEHNTSVGTVNNDNDGYHETITKFWLHLVKTYVSDKMNWSIESLCNGFINSDQSKPDYLLNFYSKDVLFSVEARRHWVEPNLANQTFTHHQ